MPTGRLVACDPFAAMPPANNHFGTGSAGRYRMVVTLADVSAARDFSHVREACATLLLEEPANEVVRRIITPSSDGSSCPAEISGDGTYWGFAVDAGTACFVDDGATAAPMRADDWLGRVFDTDKPDCWFARMDDPDHIRAGIANIGHMRLAARTLLSFIPAGGMDIFQSSEDTDASDQLIRVHIDFFVVRGD